MAPLKRKGGYKRNNASKNALTLKEASTQTENVFTGRTSQQVLQPVVLLQRIDAEACLAENKKSETSISNMSCETDSVVISEAVTTRRTSSRVMTVPNNYSVFAKPITNNQVANSTLVSGSQSNRPSYSIRVHAQKPKRVNFVRPGPLCYKKKLLNEDLAIPVMLDEIRNNSPRRNLETIFEQNSEITPPPAIEVESGPPSMKEMGTETFLNNVVESNPNHQSAESVTPVDESARPQEIPENIRLQFGAFTTVISTRSTQRKSGSSDDDDDSSDSGDGFDRRRKAKCIKIKASTVHIHNHFYKAE